ncbi:MAG TPA: GNAT family N-acetyltransferase [Candidatus Microsaccharimonas sp.]|jgi:RimJ/RimL family protein N-acetyltransferase
MLDFRFSNAPNSENQDAVANLLIQPRLWIPSGDYPAHLDWRDKALAEIAGDKKRAMIAYWGKEAVGSVVYQRDPTQPETIEIRNLSIEPYARGRHIASFLVRQVEREAALDFPGSTRMVTDTKRTNAGLIAFAFENGYHVETVVALDGTDFAHNGVQDVVLVKDLTFPIEAASF